MWQLAAAQGAGSIVSGILGNKASKKAAQAQADAIAAAMARAEQIINEVGAPPDLSEKIILDQLAQVGVLTPELEEQVKLGVSRLSQIQEDQSLRDAQVRALQEMSKRGRMGLTPEERAQMNVARQDVQKDLEAKQQQIIQNLAMRGQAGGGAEIAARLMSSQEAADRASEEADRISAMASSRALQAIQNEADMAGRLRGQDFDVETTKAKAQDEFDRFNVENQIATQQRNIAAKNIAQERNLNEAQRVADTNKQTANQERYRQAQAKRDFWSDKMRQAEAKVGVIGGGMKTQASIAGGDDRAKANMWSGIGGALNTGFGALANYYYGSKNKTETKYDTDDIKVDTSNPLYTG